MNISIHKSHVIEMLEQYVAAQDVVLSELMEDFLKRMDRDNSSYLQVILPDALLDLTKKESVG